MNFDKKELRVLKKVIDFYWDDEQTHYQESGDDERKEHMFNNLKLLRHKLKALYPKLSKADTIEWKQLDRLVECSGCGSMSKTCPCEYCEADCCMQDC